jgi:hypothetical protein
MVQKMALTASSRKREAEEEPSWDWAKHVNSAMRKGRGQSRRMPLWPQSAIGNRQSAITPPFVIRHSSFSPA